LLITFDDRHFHDSIVVFEFLGELGSSPYQPAEPCSEPGIDAFNLFSMLFTNQMLFLWQHLFERLPVIGTITVYLSAGL
jgi:hypothetical protein